MRTPYAGHVANEGEASVKIVGDVRDFARDTEKDLNAALKKVKPGAIKVPVDTDAISADAAKAGEKLADGLKRGADGRLRNAQGHFVKEGEAIGEALGDGITRGADGRLRDARGKFVKDGEALGRAASGGARKGFKEGFGDGFLDGIKNALGRFKDVLGNALSGAASAVVPIVSGIGTLVGGTFIAALAAVVLPAVLGIVSAAVIALTGIGVGLGVIGLGAFALREVKPLVESFKSLTKTLKDVGKEAAQPLLKPLQGSIGIFKDTIKDLQPTLKSIFKGIAPSIEPLAKALSGFVKNVLGGIKDSLPGINAALEGFGKGFEWAGKVLGDFFRTIFNNSDVIDNTTEALFKIIFGPLKLLGPLISGLNVIFGAWNNAIILFANSDIWSTILTGITSFVDGGTGAIQRIKDAWGPLGDAIQNVWDKIKAFAAEDDPKKLEEKFIAFVDSVKAAWGPLKDFLGVVWDEALAFIQRLWEEKFVPWWDETAKPWLESAIQEAFSIAWDAAKGAVAAKINSIIATVQTGIAIVVARIRNGIAAVPGILATAFGQANSRIASAMSTMASTAATGARTVIDRIRTGLAVAGATVRGAFSGAAGWLLSAGRQIIDGLISGIRAGFGRVRSVLGDLTSMLPSWKGPEELDKRILRESGRLVMRGFERGLLDERDAIRSTLQGLTASMPDWTGSAINSAKPGTTSTSSFVIEAGAIVINGSGTGAGNAAAEAVLARLAQAGRVR